MSARSKYRKRAVDVLYAADIRRADAVTVLTDRVSEARSGTASPINDYTIALVEGVASHQPQIDELLAEHAEGWTVQRMPAVDRAILRLGLYELLWAADVPDVVAVNEAVQLAKELSTDDSPRFVNGVLGRIAKIADQLRAVL